MRQIEESVQISNYFKKEKKVIEKKESIADKLKSKLKLVDKAFSKNDKDNCITKRDRSYGMQKIFYLHREKEYKIETLFVAAGIFDRYINIIGVSNFPRDEVIILSTISMLMAAKLEQPISPSFSRMICLLSEAE